MSSNPSPLIPAWRVRVDRSRIFAITESLDHPPTRNNPESVDVVRHRRSTVAAFALIDIDNVPGCAERDCAHHSPIPHLDPMPYSTYHALFKHAYSGRTPEYPCMFMNVYLRKFESAWLYMSIYGCHFFLFLWPTVRRLCDVPQTR